MERIMKHFIKTHPSIMEFCFFVARALMGFITLITPIKKKSVIFVSLGGRNFDDSPKAIYEKMLNDPFFDDWEIYWGFIKPDKISIPRGIKLKFGSVQFWMKLIRCQVWIGNGGLDAGIDLNPLRRIVVNTWHGSVLKKSEGEENSNAVLRKYRKTKRLDKRTIRCAQNEFDIVTYMRLFNSSKESFLKCGLPRNDILLEYSNRNRIDFKKKLGIPDEKKVILYMPTYREYLIDENNDVYIAPPIHLEKWRKRLSDNYVFLMRAHYAVSAALKLRCDEFIYDVSSYQPLSELYLIADILITDYSSCFYDYAILGKPFISFAYDRREYEKQRGLYLNLEDVMPCGVYDNETDIINKIENMDYEKEKEKVEKFREKWLPYYGHASKNVLEEVKSRLMR